MEGEMRFKTILAGVSGGSASNGALELACRFAERFGAHLEAFHARLDPRDLLTYAGEGFGAMSGEFIDRFVEDADATAKETKTSFEAAIARHQILQSLAVPAIARENGRIRGMARRDRLCPGAGLAAGTVLRPYRARAIRTRRGPATYGCNRADTGQFPPTGAVGAFDAAHQCWRSGSRRMERLGRGNSRTGCFPAVPCRRTHRLPHHGRRQAPGKRGHAHRVSRLAWN